MNNNNEVLAEYFTALSNPIRLAIYQQILVEACNCDMRKKTKPSGNCVTSIASDLDLPQPTVSNHVKVLQAVGLIKTVKVGTKVYQFADKQAAKNLEKVGIHFYREAQRHLY